MVMDTAAQTLVRQHQRVPTYFDNGAYRGGIVPQSNQGVPNTPYTYGQVWAMMAARTAREAALAAAPLPPPPVS